MLTPETRVLPPVGTKARAVVDLDDRLEPVRRWSAAQQIIDRVDALVAAGRVQKTCPLVTARTVSRCPHPANCEVLCAGILDRAKLSIRRPR